MSLTQNEQAEVLRNTMLHELRRDGVSDEAQEMFVKAFNGVVGVMLTAEFDSPKVWAYVMQGMSNYYRTVDGEDDKRVVR